MFDNKRIACFYYRQTEKARRITTGAEKEMGDLTASECACAVTGEKMNETG